MPHSKISITIPDEILYEIKKMAAERQIKISRLIAEALVEKVKKAEEEAFISRVNKVFEDPEVARLMNATFISIKVDREERPDLDHVYMTVAQMLTGRGGWPLTIIMTPDKKPFYAATYLPKESRWGHTGMMELIPQIKSAWQTRRQEILSSSEKIINALQRLENENPGDNLDLAIFDKAYQDEMPCR